MAERKGSKGGKAPAIVNFEEAMRKLDESVRKLEEGELDLEDSLKVFEEGIAWSRQCNQRLLDAERKVEILLKSDKEELAQVSFDLDDEEGTSA